MLRLTLGKTNNLIAEISRQLLVLNGTAHHTMHNLIDKGSIKVKNFSANPNKRNYTYILTPSGLSEELELAVVFLKSDRTKCYHLQEK